MTFRQAIATRAIDLDLSLAEVARRAGLTKSQLSAYVAGKREMRTDCLERLLAVLGIELTVPRAMRKANPDNQIRLSRETVAAVDALIGIIRNREGVELSRPKLVMRALCSLLLILRPDFGAQPPQPAHPA